MSRASKATSARRRFASNNGKDARQAPDDTIKEEEGEQNHASRENLNETIEANPNAITEEERLANTRIVNQALENRDGSHIFPNYPDQDYDDLLQNLEKLNNYENMVSAGVDKD